jgi:cell division protein FtsL
VESQNYLGIYLSRDTATVVCLNLLGRHGKVLGSFSVSVEENEQANMQTLVGLIAQGCAKRRWSYSEVSVALDCAIFMQHSVHSEFGDRKQIAATIRFDTEEALATDITNIALAFEITSAGQEGSELTVFTAQRKILSELLESLHVHNLDPVNIEPDVSCLSRFICRKGPSAESQQPGTLFGILSRRNGYLIIPPVSAGPESQKASTVRTFLVGPTQNRSELLSREVLVTTALVKSGEPINYLKVFDSTGTVNHQQLSEKLGIESDGIGLLTEAGTEKQIPDDSFEPVDYAIAYGAALAHSEKNHRVNFRDDFSPFQGKKLKMQQTLKFAAISVTVLLILVGLFFQTKLMSRNKDNHKLNAKFAENYSSVMLGQKSDDIKSAVKKLGTEKRRLEEAKKGLITIKGEKSISSKLTLVLTAFNKCAAQTNLNIKSITIAAKDIIVTGDTSSRQNTQKLFEAVRNNGLDVLRHNYSIKGARDHFNITLAPK